MHSFSACNKDQWYNFHKNNKKSHMNSILHTMKKFIVEGFSGSQWPKLFKVINVLLPSLGTSVKLMNIDNKLHRILAYHDNICM